MFERLKIIVAGDKKEEIPYPIWACLSEKGFAERKSVSCVGFCRDITNNNLIVVFPKAFNNVKVKTRLNDPLYVREQVFRLIRIFIKVAKETSFSREIIESDIQSFIKIPKNDPVLDSLEAALKLRDDYLRNGLYNIKKMKFKERKPGQKINWGKTFTRINPILGDNQIFYPSLFYYSREKDHESLLYKLHAQCLREIFSLTGDRIYIDSTITLDKRLFDSIKLFPKKYLRPLYRTTFNDRGRKLLLLIESYLNEARLLSLDVVKKNDLLAYSADFERIWEHVLRKILHNDNLERSLISGNWVDFKLKINSDGIKPEVDARKEFDQKELITDAKDYRIYSGSVLNRLGSSSDHYKQIIYRQLLEKGESKEFYNILAFPGIDQKSLFELSGCHYWSKFEDSLIFEVTVDYELVTKYWLGEIDLDISNELQKMMYKLFEMKSYIDSVEKIKESSGGLKL